mgnify:CR=1 FL=1
MSKELMNTTEMKEVISKRTACMKVFEHADHRFTAAIYGTPVHYMKDGHWEEIDNRLEAAADEVPADADDMENISGAFRVRLSNKVKKKQMVSLGEGSRKLTWGFVDANSVKRQILKETEEQQPDSAGALEHTADSEKDPTAAYAVRHLKSRILYPEAFHGVDIRYTIGPESLKEVCALQKDILETVWRYVKPGGTLVYSTCTVNPEENQAMAEWFVKHHPFWPKPLAGALPKGCAGADEPEGCIQLLPGIHDTDGFFISCFTRKRDGSEE